MVKAILYLAESFNLDVVAEGIEHEEQERRLCELGCKYGQGYLFARPMRAGDLLRLLTPREADLCESRRVRKA